MRQLGGVGAVGAGSGGQSAPQVGFAAMASHAPQVGFAAMAKRATPQALPAVQVVDMRDELKAGNRSMFSAALSAELRSTISGGKQAILLLNRRGYATFVLCRSCGYIATCRDCSVSYSYHLDTGRLQCHYCGMSAPMPHACPSCGSQSIRQYGAGTERVETEVRRLLPSCAVLRMDRDTTARKDSHARILGEFRDRKADILVGTQMIAKGHDFPDVTLVGALAADALLNFNDYHAPERAFQLLTQVAGRAGRGDTAGRVVIQTYNPDHYSIAAAKAHDYGAFFRQEITARRELGYPPFQHIGVAVVSGRDDGRCKEASELLYASMHGACAGLRVLPPTRPPIGKIREKHRWRMVLKHENEGAVHAALKRAVELYLKERMQAYADLAVDIDPFSLA
jgi:primosomal protein N' (replication factor Y)